MIFPAMGMSLFLTSIVGCAPSSDLPESGGMVADTLPSGRIVVRVTVPPDSPSSELHERFRIGTMDGDGPDVFGEVRDVELGLQGEIIVLDGQAGEVRVFGPDGSWLRSLGRPGQGPGELNRPAGITLDRNGLVWVLNWGNARYSAFDPTSGEVVEEHQRLASFVAFPWPGSFDADGRLVDLGLDRTSEPAILRLDHDFVPADTLALPRPDVAHQILIRSGDTPMMTAVDPFAPQPAWAPAAGGIVVGEGGSYRLHRVGFDGDTSLTVEVSAREVRVTGAERDAVLASFREVVEASGGTPERQPRVPGTKPAHGSLLVDDQDRVWVQRFLSDGERPGWDVIGPDGAYVGQFRLPVSLNATLRAVRGPRIAASGEMDGVPVVIVYEVGPGPD